MNTGMKKSLKISGILFLVAIIIFGVVYGAMAILNTGKVSLSAFEGCEKKLDTSIFTSYLDADSTDAFNFCNSMDNTINSEYDYYISYYAALKLNGGERLQVKKHTDKVKKSITALTQSYNLFKGLFENNPVTDDYKVQIKASLYENYLTKYSQVLSSKTNLLNAMKNIINSHNITIPSYQTIVFETNKICFNVALNITIPHFIESYNSDSTIAILSAYMQSAKNYLNGELDITAIADYNNIILEATTSLDALKIKYNAFNSAFQKLTVAEKDALLTSTSYTEVATGNLKIVFDFLKTEAEDGLNSFIDSASPVGTLID